MLFFKRQIISPVKRNFNPAYLKEESIQKHFEEYGYAILKNVLTEDEISVALTEFDALTKTEGYNVKNIFESSGNFKSVELQKKVFAFIYQFMSKIADRFAITENCEIGKGGAFFIKPNSQESKLEPHQDSPVIDETKTYAVFTWMPLQDIDENNGVLYVLPKSHLFGNAYRSQHVPWAFRNSCEELWKYMIPLYVNKGDIILFDPAVIHGSGINKSDAFRLVLCGALLPKNHQKVEYTLAKKNIQQFFIDDTYWLDGGDAASLSKYKSNSIQYSYPNPVKNKELNHLITSK